MGVRAPVNGDPYKPIRAWRRQFTRTTSVRPTPYSAPEALTRDGRGLHPHAECPDRAGGQPQPENQLFHGSTGGEARRQPHPNA